MGLVKYQQVTNELENVSKIKTTRIVVVYRAGDATSVSEGIKTKLNAETRN